VRSQKAVRRKAPPVKISAQTEAGALVETTKGAKSTKEEDERYRDLDIPGQRLDRLVGGRVITDLKTVEKLVPIHMAQLLSYLKTTRLRLGLLINFRVLVLKDGIERVVR
jgi:GxxExxY protein